MINIPRQELAQHARNQPNTSSLEDGQTSAIEHCARTKWSVEMNFALIEARNGAEDLVDPITECGNCKTITS